MKLFKYGVLLFLCISLTTACEEEGDGTEDEPERKTVLVTFNNDRGLSGCLSEYTVSFLVTYRDIQASLELPAQGTGFLNVLVEDGESINVQVRRQSDDEVVADANVNVRTDSRPESLEGTARTVSFCEAFQLGFQNF